MKKVLLMMFCGLLLVGCAAPVKYVSHAGDGYSAPPHSLPAYKIAIENGADYIKLDLYLTKDRVIVMQHDRTTKSRMTKNLGLSSNTYQKLYDECTYKKVGGFANEKIVRLDQALELIKDSKCQIWIDFKGYCRSLVEETMKMLAKYEISHDRVMVATWNVYALKYMQKNYPDVRRVLHVNVFSRPQIPCMLSFTKSATTPETVMSEILKIGKELELYGFNMPIISKFYKKEWIKQLKDEGYWVSLWFVQNAEMAKKAFEAHPDAVVTDNIKVVKPIIRAAEQNL